MTTLSHLAVEDVSVELIQINCRVGVLEKKYKVPNKRMSIDTSWKIFQTSKLHIRDIQHHYSVGHRAGFKLFQDYMMMVQPNGEWEKLSPLQT